MAVRCAVVMAGPEMYARVLNDPHVIAARPWPGVADAERLAESTDRVFAELSVAPADDAGGSGPRRLGARVEIDP